jgi:hypothetical protein
MKTEGGRGIGTSTKLVGRDRTEGHNRTGLLLPTTATVDRGRPGRGQERDSDGTEDGIGNTGENVYYDMLSFTTYAYIGTLTLTYTHTDTYNVK